jgi:hypothetical protein
VPIILGILVLALPLFSRSVIYRTATIFAAANAAIVTMVFFVDILSPRSGFIDGEAIAYYLVLSLPSLYLASLLVGATIVPKGVRNTTAYLRAALTIVGSVVAVVYLTPLIFKIIGALLFGSPRTGLQYYLITKINTSTLRPLIALAASALVAATATLIIMRRLQRTI